MRTATDQLWDQYRRRGDQSARARLLEQYIGLVQHCARELIRKVSPEVELDDLVSAGTLGLVQAIEGFDPARGLVFSTYGMQRIRGAMLDEMRSRDWMPRSARSRQRRLAQVVGALEARLSRPPRQPEVAAALGVDLDTYWSDWADDGQRHLLSFESPTGEGGDGPRLEETIADDEAAAPDAGLAHEDRIAELQDALETLSPQERIVLTLYHYEEMNLKQIGEVLHVTESRVSQIRTKALRRLRDNAGLCGLAA
jgi:RNA polymerase sigma factor for flagellar operon FliA